MVELEMPVGEGAQGQGQGQGLEVKHLMMRFDLVVVCFVIGWQGSTSAAAVVVLKM
jgi:hypothetical protein